MMRYRIEMFFSAILTTLCLAWSAVALSAPWPERPITLVVPFAGGGATDIAVRDIARKMSEDLGQPIVIENKPGAGSMLGAQIVARAKPDGYTLLTATGANMITGPLLTENQIFTPDKDIQPIALLSVNPLVLVASNESGIKTLADLIAMAKAKPGQLAIGSYGVGTPPHLAIELLKMRMGVDVIHVPYNGSAPAMVDLRGGRIPVLMDFLPSQVKPISDREVVGLAIGQNKRSELVPSVPTFDQAGLAGLEITTFFGLAGPVGIPKEIVLRINEAARRALSDPALQKSMAARGLTLAHSTSEGFEQALKKETAQAKLIIQSAGIKSLD